MIGAAAGEVQSIAVVRGLPLAEAAQGQFVRIRGVVTVRPRNYVPTEAAIVQDDTGGVWVSLERLTVIPEELERGVAVTGGLLAGGGIPQVVYGRSRFQSTRRLAHGRCPLRVSRAPPPPAACRPRATPPRKHRHRYHGVFAPNHPLRPAVTALAIGNIGKRREAAAGGHARDGHGTGGCCDSSHATQKPRSHDTSRLAWAKLMARVGEEFPLECPSCGGDIRLISFITEPGPIRKILTHLGEPLEPPPLAPARRPPTEWGELVQTHDDRAIFQASPNELPVIDIHSL